MVSKIQRKPFWLATQTCSQSDWSGWQNGVNCDIFAQAPLLHTLTLKSISFKTIHTRAFVTSDGVSACGVGMTMMNAFLTLVDVWSEWINITKHSVCIGWVDKQWNTYFTFFWHQMSRATSKGTPITYIRINLCDGRSKRWIWMSMHDACIACNRKWNVFAKKKKKESVSYQSSKRRCSSEKELSKGHSTDHTMNRLLLLQFHAKCAIFRSDDCTFCKKMQ